MSPSMTAKLTGRATGPRASTATRRPTPPGEQPGALLAAQDLQDRVRRRPAPADRKAPAPSKQVGRGGPERGGKTGHRTGARLGWAPFQVLHVAPCHTSLVLELLTRQPQLLAA